MTKLWQRSAPDDLDVALDAVRRIAERRLESRRSVSSPHDMAALCLADMSTLEQEELWVTALDTRNRVLAINHIYRGSLNTSVVRVGELFRDAIKQNAASIIVTHNHPSGDPSPSPEDEMLTRTIVDAGKILEVKVLDHIVIAGGKYVSMKAQNLGGLEC